MFIYFFFFFLLLGVIFAGKLADVALGYDTVASYIVIVPLFFSFRAFC